MRDDSGKLFGAVPAFVFILLLLPLFLFHVYSALTTKHYHGIFSSRVLSRMLAPWGGGRGLIDRFAADVLCSLSKELSLLVYASCYYFSGAFLTSGGEGLTDFGGGMCRQKGMETASAVLTGANSLIFFIAVVTGHVLATSLGYYIMPLINVLIGTMFLHEKLSRVQWAAVVIAATGIGLLAFGELDMLFVAMALGVTYALYGFVRKVVPAGALEAVTIETGVSLLPALAVVGWYATAGGGSSLTTSWQMAVLLMIGGLFTAIPLLLFGYAARRLTLSAMGFAQFITPSIGFLLGHFLYGEPLDAARTACFVLIWTALALFTWDMFRQTRLNSHTKTPA
jgi:chloramphenicol-sensitive protein RarD